MKIRLARTRGIAKNEWIESRRTFSNNQYYNPEYMNWGNLKVINDDILQPGHMVPKHEHKNFDILGYLIEGKLEHWDTCGNLNTAEPGEIQHMWCGRSIWHTERCISTTPARYLQIWITPEQQYFNTEPFYEIAVKSLDYGPIPIQFRQNISINAGNIAGNHTINTTNAYLYIVSGTVRGDDFTLEEGDGAYLTEPITAEFAAHILLFEQ